MKQGWSLLSPSGCRLGLAHSTKLLPALRAGGGLAAYIKRGSYKSLLSAGSVATLLLISTTLAGHSVGVWLALGELERGGGWGVWQQVVHVRSRIQHAAQPRPHCFASTRPCLAAPNSNLWHNNPRGRDVRDAGGLHGPPRYKERQAVPLGPGGRAVSGHVHRVCAHADVRCAA